jgi:hypothetical protein
MTSFILRHNIARFRDLLAETTSMSERRVLGELLATRCESRQYWSP